MTGVTRIVLASLVSLGVILGIYTGVKGASLNLRQQATGAHQVSGIMANFDRYRAAQSNLNWNQVYQQGPGHGGCNSDSHFSPQD